LVLTAPLGNRVDDRRDKRPTLLDIPDGSGLESVADIITFLYRDEFYTKGACKQAGVLEVNIGRQRIGPVGVVKLAFCQTISKFVPLDSSEWPD
jgi:replicative DNA helicase